MLLPLALTVCMCFSWRNTLEALLCGVHAYTRNEKRSRSDVHFIDWFHSSQFPVFVAPGERKGRCKLERRQPDQESRRLLSKWASAAAAWQADHSQERGHGQ